MTVIRRSTQAYFLPYEGRTVAPIYQGGNIFRRVGRFFRRNVPSVLRRITPFIPRVADWVVREGARRGHIPESHRRIYENSLRPYVRRAPELLSKPIDELDKILNPKQEAPAPAPAPEANATVTPSVTQEGGRSVVVKHDFSLGGNISGNKKKTKRKVKQKVAPTPKKMTSGKKAKPKIGTAEYHNIIDQHLAQFGAGILQTSISHDMTHI